jgi:hypothetical protein
VRPLLGAGLAAARAVACAGPGYGRAVAGADTGADAGADTALATPRAQRGLLVGWWRPRFAACSARPALDIGCDGSGGNVHR